MRGEYHLCTMFDGVFDRRQSTENTRVVRDDAVFDRNVEINADKYPFAVYIYVFDGFFVHGIFSGVNWNKFGLCEYNPLRGLRRKSIFWRISSN